MSIVADSVDFEAGTISNARLVNAKSRNGLFFTPNAMTGIAKHGQGKPIMLNEHHTVGISENVGVVKGLVAGLDRVTAGEAKFKKSHPETAGILETAADLDFAANCGFSVEIHPDDYEFHIDKGVKVVTEVRGVTHFVLATHTGNTNGIYETKQNESPEVKQEKQMSIETVGDLRTAHPKLVGEVELSAKAEAEKSIAEEIAALQVELEASKAEALEAKGKVAAFEQEKQDAEAAEKLLQAEADIEQKLTACGCDCSIAETRELISEHAALGNQKITDGWIAGMTRNRKGTGLRDGISETAAPSREEIIARRRKAKSGK